MLYNVSKVADGGSKEGKQVLFILTATALIFTIVYYHNQVKLAKIKLKDEEKENAELHLSSLG